MKNSRGDLFTVINLPSIDLALSPLEGATGGEATSTRVDEQVNTLNLALTLILTLALTLTLALILTLTLTLILTLTLTLIRRSR